MFSPDEVRQAVMDDLKYDLSVPDGHKFASVVFFNEGKVEVGVAWKVTDHWVVQLKDSYTTDHGNEVGVISKITF